MQLILSLRHCLRTNGMSYAEQFKLMQPYQCRNSYSEIDVPPTSKVIFQRGQKMYLYQCSHYFNCTPNQVE